MWSPERTERLLQGTVATGAGLSLLAILMDQIRSERRKTMADKGRVLDASENTLYLNPVPTASQKQATLAEWTIGGFGGIGAYMLIQKAYQEMRKKQLQREVEEADRAYTESLVASTNKQAAEEEDLNVKFALSLTELLANAPKDTLFLSGLAGAAGTYGLLEHVWPKVSEKAEGVKPSKIVVKGFGTVVADGPGDGPLAQLDKARGKKMVDEELEEETAPKEEEKPVSSRPWMGNLFQKAASLTAPVNLEDYQAAAALIAFGLMENTAMKVAGNTLHAVIGSRASAGPQFSALFAESDPVDAMDLTRGGYEHYNSLSPVEKMAAVHEAFSDPMLRPTLALLTAAEMYEHDPDLCKRAQVVNADPEVSVMAAKAASLLWHSNFLLSLPKEKSASLRRAQEDMRRQMGTLSVSDSEDSQGESDKADEAYQTDDDPIDRFMAGKK